MSADPARQQSGTETEIDSEVLARQIARIATDKGAEEVVVIGIGELVSYTDFLVICTARNERLGKAIRDEVRIRLKGEHGIGAAREEGLTEGRWILCDYLHCILHIMSPDARQRYRLEQLWGEAGVLEAGAEDPPQPPQ